MDKAKIHYYDIGDYLSREDKLRIIKQFGSIEHINFSSHSVAFNMQRMIYFYNKQQEEYSQAIKNNSSLNVEDFVEQNPTKISWTRSLRNSILT